MKLIVTNSLPTSLLFGSLLQLSVIEASGIEIEFWDLAPLHFDKDILNEYFSGAANYEFTGPKHKKFESHSSLAIAISENRNAIFWHLSRFGKIVDDEPFILLLNEFNCRYFFQHIDVHDDVYSLTQWPRFVLREVRQKILNRHCRPAAVVTSGTLGNTQVSTRYPGALIIDVRTPKIEWRDVPRVIKEPYTVFVDESFAHDPDTKLHGTRLINDIPGYYARMRTVFDITESALGCPILICCSGKYHYQDPKDFFGNREVIYRQTKELIAHSQLVLGHLSLALDQAIVSDKPVVLIDDPDFTSYRRFGFRDVVKRLRTAPILNTDITSTEIFGRMYADRSFYPEIIQRYFRSSIESPNIGEAVISFLGSFSKQIYRSIR